MSNSHSFPLPGLGQHGWTLRRFVWVVLSLIAFIMLVTFGSLALHQQVMRALVGDRDERAVRTAASALTEQINHLADAGHSLSLRAADGLPPDNILLSSNFLLTDFDAGLAFFSPEGQLLAQSGDNSLWTFNSETFQIELDLALTQAGTEPRFSPAVPGPNGSREVVLMSASAQPGGPIVIGAFFPSTLAEHTLSNLFGTDGQGNVYLISSSGQVLFSTVDNPQLTDPLSHPGVREAFRGESGALYISEDGIEHVIAFQRVMPLEWALIIEEPWESVSSPLLNTTLFAPLILLPGLLLSLVALWFGIRQIIQPLQNLEQRAHELAWGDFISIETTVGGIDEINRLQNTLIYLARKIQANQNSLRGYIGAITTGQEEERRRLARELHDETIQSLIALNQRVQLAQMDLEDTHIAEQLDEIQIMTEHTIKDLRRLTQGLRPLYLEDLGLVPALDMLAGEMQQTFSMPVSFRWQGPERRLPPEVELGLYRIAQEGLSNIERHAHSKQASLEIEFRADKITLTISDNGRGFKLPESPAEFASEGHFGLLGLHERAELLKAKLEIITAPGQGTRLVVNLPYPEGKI